MDDFLDFLEDDNEEIQKEEFWTILITDDSEDVHRTTKFAFSGVTVLGKKIKFIDAYTGKEAEEIVQQNDDVDLMLLDAVMETETAGLDCATFIKKTLKKKIPIIIMRSGFAGWELEYNKHQTDVLDDFIMKTQASKDKLIEKVTQWLSYVQ